MSFPLSAFGQYTARSPALGNLTVQAGLQHLDASSQFQVQSTLTESRVALENLWASARYERRWSDVVSTSAWVSASRGNPTRDEALFLTGNKATAYLPRYGLPELTTARWRCALGPGGLRVGGGFSDGGSACWLRAALLDIPTGSPPRGSLVEPAFPAGDPYLVDISDEAAFARLALPRWSTCT